MSIVVPVRDEAATLADLVVRLDAAVGPRLREIVLVDDASRDGSWDLIVDLAARYPVVRGLRLSHRCGAIPSVATGAARAVAPITCSIDADLENAPEDVPLLLAALDRGADLVGGVRVDQAGREVVHQVLAGLVRAWLHRRWRVAPRDFGCGLKAWRSEVGATCPPVVAGGGIEWAVRLFDAASCFEEVDVGYQRADRPSRVGLRAKTIQGIDLGLALCPRRSLATSGAAAVAGGLVGLAVAPSRTSRALAGATLLVGATAALVAGAARRRDRRVHAAGTTVVVAVTGDLSDRREGTTRATTGSAAPS